MPISLKDYRLQRAQELKQENSSRDSELEHLLSRLGEMSPADYGIQRHAIADKTGIPLKYLDAEYDARRKNVKEDRRKTIERAYWQVEPWPESVEGAVLIEQIEKGDSSSMLL
jgi:hypothetical protein